MSAPHNQTLHGGGPHPNATWFLALARSLCPWWAPAGKALVIRSKK